MNDFNYPVNLQKQDDGGYLVTFPDFPEAITQGKTINDAMIEASDCLEEAIANRVQLKLDIPSGHDSNISKPFITLPKKVSVKIRRYLSEHK